MNHDGQKIILYHNFHLFFPICDWKEFRIFQLLENSKKQVLMHRSVAKDRPCIVLQGVSWQSEQSNLALLRI
jgi:hypothetical protein